jgi:hypothetical protein
MEAAGEYYFYNKSRLLDIAGHVEHLCDINADFDFYMGFTPWILSKNPWPYVAWNDCSFSDYLHIYHNPDNFDKSQRCWIQSIEVHWMRGASRIFISSEWFMGRMKSDYQLSAERLESLGIFGSMEIPKVDAWV